MKFINKISTPLLFILAVVQTNVNAKVTPEEAAKLGKELTLIGAEKAGNQAGTIPAYTGGLTADRNVDYRVNIFADEQPLFTITAKNVDQYQDNLSPGQIALLKQYPDTYFMPVYKTHRTASQPQQVLHKAKVNALNTVLLDDGNGLGNFDETIPFAIPKSGLEVIWNHITRYRGGNVARNFSMIPVQRNGSFTPVKLVTEFSSPQYISDGYDENKDDNILFYYTSKITSPARLSGTLLLIHETIDQIKAPRKAWTYNPGQRRVRRAPNVAYDAPNNGSDGLRTTDQVDMFAGSPMRYNWKIVGKKELYIPYNSYALANPDLEYDDMVQANHVDQTLTRYELHRVWQIEASIKDKTRNIYSKRVFYIDEDSWQISIADLYDDKNLLWRVSEAHQLQYAVGNTNFVSAEIYHDLMAERYLAILSNEIKEPIVFEQQSSRKDFSLGALRRSGKR
ncbi:MAG: DUF1329 domain-containing protein [Colwellia sp.]|uniref:DUF1329 domain-containing protein n=1 Tax=Colwellia sp. TaxID=56799 RepID=UPI0025C1EDAF|nr:DUF1329 domain-containing protein [Colwellia sp.]NQZ28706.1 DUF1329 domain-containing protein [Colwellia sp.]